MLLKRATGCRNVLVVWSQHHGAHISLLTLSLFVLVSTVGAANAMRRGSCQRSTRVVALRTPEGFPFSSERCYVRVRPIACIVSVWRPGWCSGVCRRLPLAKATCSSVGILHFYHRPTLSPPTAFLTAVPARGVPRDIERAVASRWAAVPAVAVLSRSSPCTFFLSARDRVQFYPSCSRLLGTLSSPTRLLQPHTVRGCSN